MRIAATAVLMILFMVCFPVVCEDRPESRAADWQALAIGFTANAITKNNFYFSRTREMMQNK
jgi:hypothetical protein